MSTNPRSMHGLPTLAGCTLTRLTSRRAWQRWLKQEFHDTFSEPSAYPCLAYTWTDHAEWTTTAYIYEEDAVCLLRAFGWVKISGWKKAMAGKN